MTQLGADGGMDWDRFRFSVVEECGSSIQPGATMGTLILGVSSGAHRKTSARTGRHPRDRVSETHIHLHVSKSGHYYIIAGWWF